jgi:hypothetical protein
MGVTDRGHYPATGQRRADFDQHVTLRHVSGCLRGEFWLSQRIAGRMARKAKVYAILENEITKST